MKIAFLLLTCLFAVQVSDNENSEAPYKVTVGGKDVKLNAVSEQYNEGVYYWTRFDCKGKVKLNVATSFDLKDVVFKNISVVGDQSSFSGDIYLKGRSESESIGTITFENVNFFGQPVNDSPKHTLFVGEHAAEPIFR